MLTDDVLSLLSEELSPHENNSSPINHNSTNYLINGDTRHQQPIVKPRHINGWSNEPNGEYRDINNRSTDKENTKPLEEVNSKPNKQSKGNNSHVLKTDLEITDKANDNILSDTEEKINHNKIKSAHEESLNDLDISLERCSPCDGKSETGHEENEKTASTSNETDDHNTDRNGDNTHTRNERNGPKTKDKTREIQGALLNDTMQETKHRSSEEGKTKENYLSITDAVEMSPILNNTENKLNYRPSSTERARNYGKTKPVIPQNGDKVREDKLKIDMSKNRTNKKTATKSKLISGKQDTANETTSRSVRPQTAKTHKSDGTKVQVKDSLKAKDADSKSRPSRRNTEEPKETYDISEGKETSDVLDATLSSVVEKPGDYTTEHPKLKEMLLSRDEVKSKLEEIKERNRNKLVVLVPPFEQYKSYMNDNYSDDNESFDLEEFLRKENGESDLAYFPDFELESDNELDKMCKENACFSDLEEIFPENLPSNQKTRNKFNASMRKKTNGSTSGKRQTRSAEDDDLRRHQCKMMDNIKRSQQYESNVRLTQDNGESNVKCKQKCSQRPSTAPGGRKYCDCKWPRVKLPEYNGLRSEYGLSAEQLGERKR